MPTMLRSLFLIACAFLCLLKAQGSTIENFTIVYSSNPGIPGGGFSDGETYYGDFSI